MRKAVDIFRSPPRASSPITAIVFRDERRRHFLYISFTVSRAEKPFFLRALASVCRILPLYCPIIYSFRRITQILYLLPCTRRVYRNIYEKNQRCFFFFSFYTFSLAGFLNVNAEPYQKARVANYGLMDQIAALDWIRQNIGHFDGDAKNITLLGHGTGAACINFLMVSPAAMPGTYRERKKRKKTCARVFRRLNLR